MRYLPLSAGSHPMSTCSNTVIQRLHSSLTILLLQLGFSTASLATTSERANQSSAASAPLELYHAWLGMLLLAAGQGRCSVHAVLMKDAR